MPGQLAAGIFHQLLERPTLIREPTLQGTRAQVQLSGHILQRRALAGQQLLHSPFHLLAYGFLRQLPLELGLQLGRNYRE